MLQEIGTLTLGNCEGYGASGVAVLVGSDALVDISIVQGQAFDLKVEDTDLGG